MWFTISIADAGWFPQFIELGSFYGSYEAASQLLGYLLAAGVGASKVFLMQDESGMPILPMAPAGPSTPAPLPGGGQFPWFPGAQPGATPWWEFPTF